MDSCYITEYTHLCWDITPSRFEEKIDLKILDYITGDFMQTYWLTKDVMLTSHRTGKDTTCYLTSKEGVRSCDLTEISVLLSK